MFKQYLLCGNEGMMPDLTLYVLYSVITER